MNCQEVMDYMQRQLDGDLDERETELLLHHTRQCPDCAAMFERLKRLSAELENLPKVTPSYSLVDAIMPKLEQLELQGQPVETEQPERTVPIGSRRKPQERKPRWSQRISFRAFGGVIAAGIVVGLFLVTYQPNGMRTADDSASMNSAASGAETFSAQRSGSADGGESTSAKNASPEASDSLENSSPDPKTMKIKVTSKDGDSKNDSAGSMESAPASEEPEVSEQATGGNAGKSDHQVTPSSTPANGEADSNSEPENSMTITDQSGPEVDQNGDLKQEEASNTQRAEEQESEAREATELYFTAAPSEPLVSPDGVYQAVVQGDTVQILTTSDDTVLFETAKSGSIANLVWSEDSTTVTFEVNGAEQKAERYRIDVAKKSEVKIAG
ncbi:zf-HC2 domain-containing protein [Paenibacillus tarimensis]